MQATYYDQIITYYINIKDRLRNCMTEHYMVMALHKKKQNMSDIS